MSFARLFLSALGGTVAYFAIGFLAFATLPLKSEFAKYPAVYRGEDGIKAVMPFGMAGIFISILALAVIYAGLARRRSGWVDGLRFGVFVGVFAVGAFVLHNYVNLNISFELTIQQAAMYFVEWIAVGVVIGMIYRDRLPLAPN